MNDFRTRKKQTDSWTQSWFFLFFLLLVLGFFARSAYASFVKKRHADQERLKYEERVNELLLKKQALQERIENLNTERGVEEELRKRFNIVKPGETLIRIIEKPDTQE